MKSALLLAFMQVQGVGIDVYGVDLVFAYSHAVGVVMSFVEGLVVCFFLLRVFFFFVFFDSGSLSVGLGITRCMYMHYYFGGLYISSFMVISGVVVSWRKVFLSNLAILTFSVSTPCISVIFDPSIDP